MRVLHRPSMLVCSSASVLEYCSSATTILRLFLPNTLFTLLSYTYITLSQSLRIRISTTTGPRRPPCRNSSSRKCITAIRTHHKCQLCWHDAATSNDRGETEATPKYKNIRRVAPDSCSLIPHQKHCTHQNHSATTTVYTSCMRQKHHFRMFTFVQLDIPLEAIRG